MDGVSNAHWQLMGWYAELLSILVSEDSAVGCANISETDWVCGNQLNLKRDFSAHLPQIRAMARATVDGLNKLNSYGHIMYRDVMSMYMTVALSRIGQSQKCLQ